LINYIHSSTTFELNKVLFHELLTEHQAKLLDKKTGLTSFFDAMEGGRKTDAADDLSRLYNLYVNLKDEGIQPIARRMQEYISREGQQHVERAKRDMKTANSTKKEIQFIDNLLKLHVLFCGIVNKQFKNNYICEKAVVNGFKDFINLETFVAERLAWYSHIVLKRGGNEMVKTPITVTFNNIVKLYEYINDKDWFELSYQKYLAERLINDSSYSNDNEKTMIGKLKLVGGNAGWCRKLENMFKDIETSKFVLKEFYTHESRSDNVFFACRICTYGQWETDRLDILPMPQQVNGITEAFKNFYENKFSGRTLEYRLDKGNAELVVHFRGTESKTLVVCPHQMAILLKFNEQTI